MARAKVILSRDEIVGKGLISAASSEDSFLNGNRTNKFLYKVKTRKSNKAIQNIELSAWTIPHLKAILIMDLAEENLSFNAISISRVMKARMRSPREDY